MDNFIVFLKDEANFRSLWLYLLVVLILFAILKKVLKSKNILKFFTYLVKIFAIFICLLIIGNIILNENYSKLIYLIIAFLSTILIINFAKFLKWYDDNVDKYIGRK